MDCRIEKNVPVDESDPSLRWETGKKEDNVEKSA